MLNSLISMYAVNAVFSVVTQSRMPAITIGCDHYTPSMLCAQAATRFPATRVLQRAADFIANHFLLLAALFYDVAAAAAAADCDN